MEARNQSRAESYANYRVVSKKECMNGVWIRSKVKELSGDFGVVDHLIEFGVDVFSSG